MARTEAKRKTTGRPAPARPAWMWSLLAAGWGLCLLALGGWVLDYARDPANLPLKVIRINGELVHLQPERLQRVVAAAVDGGFFSVDMNKVRDAVKDLSWVDQVSVRRVWPHTLVMDVSEQVAVARWGRDALVNARGEVFSPDGVAIEPGLVHLYGPDDSAQRVVSFQRELREQLAPLGLEPASLRLEKRRDWQVQTRDGLTLVMSSRQSAAQLRRFLAAYPVLAADPAKRAERVDMRYGHGFAVRWQERELSDKGEQKTSKRGNA